MHRGGDSTYDLYSVMDPAASCQDFSCLTGSLAAGVPLVSLGGATVAIPAASLERSHRVWHPLWISVLRCLDVVSVLFLR